MAGRVKWPDFAHLAHHIGFPGTDILFDGAYAAGAEATRGLLDQLNLKAAAIGLPVDFRSTEEAFRKGLAGLDGAARFAAAIGCPRMTTWFLPSSDLPKPQQRRVYVDRWSACAEVLARHGVRFGIEFVSPVHLRKRHPHEFIWRMDETLDLAKDCGPNVGVLLDSWHWHHAEATAADIRAAGKDRIVHVQVADAPNLPPDRIVDNERLMPGEGVLDWGAFFGALKQIGYEDGISPEVFGRGLKDMEPAQGAQLGYDTTMAVMRKAGVA
ncbi:MAG: sugar phosphate isomerase/epimerase [Bryobacterales bacterium]|nr:sugar phosphate isomerase/epimerase [Bryobacterales bacterium]